MTRLTILLFFTTALLAQPHVGPATRPSIQGRVIDSETGKPIADALITLTPPMTRVEPGPEAYRITNSDLQGRFSLWAVAPGVYDLTAERSGFVQGAAWRTSLTLPLATQGPIVIRLTPQGIIRGRVTDGDGDIPPKAWVSVSGVRFYNGERQFAPTNTVKVREDGTFVLGGLLPGHYYVSASVSSNTNPAIEPLPTRAIVNTFYPDSTDMASASLIDVHSGQEINGISIRLRTQPLYRVRGRLEGIENAQLGLLPEDQSQTTCFVGAPIRIADGAFDFATSPGKCVIIGRESRKAGSGLGIFVYQPLKVDRDLDHIVIEAPYKVDLVRGTVRDEQGTVPSLSNGQRLSLDLSSMISVWKGQNFPVDVKGSIIGPDPFSFIPGPVRAELLGLASEYFVKSIRFDGANVNNQSFILPVVGGTFEVTVARGAGSVSGVVRTAKGNVPETGWVTIWSTPEQQDGSRGFSAVTRIAEGVFKFDNLPPGPYAIAAWEGIEQGLAQYPGFFRAFEPSAIRLTLNIEARETVALTAISHDVSEIQAIKLR